MDYKVENLNEFQVVGISVRTTNENDQSLKDIGALWNKFYFDNIMGKISQKENEEIIALYTDYEKDEMKPYSVLLGHRVKNISFIPEGMASKFVPASKYAIFHVKGKLPHELVKAWKHIWKSNLERTYSGDFEIYSKENEVDIYVSIK